MPQPSHHLKEQIVTDPTARKEERAPGSWKSTLQTPAGRPWTLKELQMLSEAGHTVLHEAALQEVKEPFPEVSSRSIY